MFTTAELFYYFHLPAICLYLVAWWIYRRNRAQKSPDLLAAQRKNPSPGFAPWPPRPRTVHNPGAGQVCLWSCARPSSCAFPRVQAHPISRYNQRMAVRLIALDIDGTLLDSRWQLPEANRAAIAEATRRGIEVALVTGRRYDFAIPVARQLDSPLTMIVNNGALIRSKDGRTHLRHLLPRSTAEQVLELTKPWRKGAAVIFDRQLENQLMLEVLDPDDSMRYAYYSRNMEVIGLANPR